MYTHIYLYAQLIANYKTHFTSAALRERERERERKIDRLSM